jgi:hypothetical protein
MMSVQRNIEARLRNHCCRRKAISIRSTYCVCMCVCIFSYPASKAHAPYYIVICGLSASTIFFHVTLKTGKKFIEHKMCVLIFSTTFIRNICHFKTNSARCYVNVNTSLCKVPAVLVGP